MTQTTPNGTGSWQPQLETALHAAKEAGRLQLDALGKTHTVDFKGPTEPVTEVDRACEDAIVGIIRGRFPSHDFLLEETSMPRTGSPCLWVVDPLDGTVNYAHGFPHFCCSIALQVEGETVLGVVWDPIRQELFSAVRSCGAFLNGTRIHVSQEQGLIHSLLATGFPYDIPTADDNNLDKFNRMILHAQAIRRSGAAVLDLSYVAAGRLDGFWAVQISPWDAAAGVLLVEEAGGLATDLTAKPIGNQTSKLLATNGRVHDSLMNILNDSP